MLVKLGVGQKMLHVDTIMSTSLGCRPAQHSKQTQLNRDPQTQQYMIYHHLRPFCRILPQQTGVKPAKPKAAQDTAAGDILKGGAAKLTPHRAAATTC
jgi:hypothetical protein